MLDQWTDWWSSEKGGTRVRQGASEGLPQREVALDKQSGREMHSRRGSRNTLRHQRQAGSFLLLSRPGNEYKVLWCFIFFFKTNSLKPHSVGRVPPYLEP